MEFLEGLEGVSPQQIQEYKTAALEAERFATGGFTAIGAAYAAGQGTVALVGLLAQPALERRSVGLVALLLGMLLLHGLVEVP
jgi:hypothetical protein